MQTSKIDTRKGRGVLRPQQRGGTERCLLPGRGPAGGPRRGGGRGQGAPAGLLPPLDAAPPPWLHPAVPRGAGTTPGTPLSPGRGGRRVACAPSGQHHGSKLRAAFVTAATAWGSPRPPPPGRSGWSQHAAPSSRIGGGARDSRRRPRRRPPRRPKHMPPMPAFHWTGGGLTVGPILASFYSAPPAPGTDCTDTRGSHLQRETRDPSSEERAKGRTPHLALSPCARAALSPPPPPPRVHMGTFGPESLLDSSQLWGREGMGEGGGARGDRRTGARTQSKLGEPIFKVIFSL